MCFLPGDSCGLWCFDDMYAFCIPGPLWGESAGWLVTPVRFPSKSASNVWLWCLTAVWQTVELPVIHEPPSAPVTSPWCTWMSAEYSSDEQYFFSAFGNDYSPSKFIINSFALWIFGKLFRQTLWMSSAIRFQLTVLNLCMSVFCGPSFQLLVRNLIVWTNIPGLSDRQLIYAVQPNWVLRDESATWMLLH